MDDYTDNRFKTSRPLSKTLFEYANAATTHGIFYIFESGRWILERIFWVIVVIIAILLAVTWSWWAYDKWEDEPMLTTIATTGLPIQTIPFPSITICAQGEVKNTKKVITNKIKLQLE